MIVPALRTLFPRSNGVLRQFQNSRKIACLASLSETHQMLQKTCRDFTDKLSRGSASVGVISAVTQLYLSFIQDNATEAQKEKFLTPFTATGDVCSFALSEPGNGSDAGAASTTAVLDGNNYVINGTKAWITNAAESVVAV
uniref:Acyl-CoA oxidase/dehydrogenase middle domain-containing protein n=1 Tax=Megaselia scalaris TaxID=36166 RepID=T1H242_MEGSC